MEKSKERLEVLKKIELYESSNMFNSDVENDPPSKQLKPNQIDYLKKSPINKIKTKLANKIGRKFISTLIENKDFVINDIIGLENLNNLTSGAILTQNHFNPFDNFALQLAFEQTHFYKNKKLYKVIREGNYTSMTGFFGKLLRNCDTLPLSSNVKTMMKFVKSLSTILHNGNLVVIYPEQAMWWNYKKPRPLKDGAFKFAVKNNVPIVPCFVTLTETQKIGNDGFPVLSHTLFIDKPIYMNPNLSVNENIQNMKDKNFEVWKNIYESFYKTKLVYSSHN